MIRDKIRKFRQAGRQADDPILSYHDILLTREDIKALQGDWLTDNNIAFWEEWIERETLPHYPKANICLMRPSVALIVMRGRDVDSIRSAIPNLDHVTHIFMPLNDNREVGVAEGGTHWSLLLVSAIDGIAFHYDSMGRTNYNEGYLATQKMSQLLGRRIRFLHLSDTPQQTNTNDCGVFVCLIMRHLLVKRLLNATSKEKVKMSMGDKVLDAQGMRKEMLRVIETLRKEAERRRSRSASPLPSTGPNSAPRIEY